MTTATRRPYCFSWLPITMVTLVVALLAVFPVQDFDLFWHMANGRAMVEGHTIINQEIFSFTAQGKHFSNHEWLAQIILYEIFHHLGANGLIAFKVLMVTAVGLTLYRFCRRRGMAPLPAALLWLWAYGASSFRYVERPELFSSLLLAWLGAMLFSYRAKKAPAWALALLPLAIGLWDCLHGALFGVIVLGAFLAGEMIRLRFPALGGGSVPTLARPAWRRLGLWLLATLAVMLISPYGLRTYGIFFEFMHHNLMTSMTAEFQPPKLNEMPLFWLLLLASGLTALGAGRRGDWAALFVYLPFAGLALRYVRGIGPFAIVAVLVMGEHLPALLARLAQGREAAGARMNGLLHLLLALGLGLAVCYKFSSPPRYDSWGLGISDDGFPVGSARFVKAVNLKGHMYNTDRYGGYLAYYLYPERKIFHYNHHLLFTALERYVHDPESRAQWQINYAIIGRSDEWSMFTDDGFVPVYWEPTAAVMVKNTPANQPLIRRYAIQYFSPVMPDKEFMRLAKDPAVLPRLAQETSDYLAWRRDPDKTRLLVKMLGGQALVSPQECIRLLTPAEAHNSQTPELMSALGELYYRQGAPDRAGHYLRAALRIDPHLVAARFSLAFLHYDQGRFPEAVDDFNQLGADAAQHPDIAYGLGLALDKLGRREEANQAFKRYLELAPNGPWAKQARDFLVRPRLGG